MITFDTVKASWKESLGLLKIDSIKLLALVSLRTLLFLYSSIIYAWFLPLVLLVGLQLDLKVLIAACYLSVLVKAARPSVELKHFRYWQTPMVVDLTIFFGVLFLWYVPPFFFKDEPHWIASLYDFILKLFFLSGPEWIPGSETLGMLLVFMSPFLVLWVLFMLDAKVSFFSYVKAFGRAIAMLIYNYPFFLVTYAALRGGLALGYLLGLPLVRVAPYSIIVGWLLLLAVIIPYWICFLTNFYTKRLHEQFSLYYGK